MYYKKIASDQNSTFDGTSTARPEGASGLVPPVQENTFAWTFSISLRADSHSGSFIKILRYLTHGRFTVCVSVAQTSSQYVA